MLRARGYGVMLITAVAKVKEGKTVKIECEDEKVITLNGVSRTRTMKITNCAVRNADVCRRPLHPVIVHSCGLKRVALSRLCCAS